MSIKATLSSDGLEEVFTPPTLKEMCLYKCWTTKEILTKEVDKATNGSDKISWGNYRLKEPLQKDLVAALLDAGDEFFFRLTPKYEPVLAAIRMSQPEHLVKVQVSNTKTLVDRQLEFLLSAGNVKSLDIHGCKSLSGDSLNAINTFGSKLEYLRIGNCFGVLPNLYNLSGSGALLRTPKLKTFIVTAHTYYESDRNITEYWRRLLLDFITNLEDLQISRSGTFKTFDFLEPAKSKLSSLSLKKCWVTGPDAWAFLFELDKLKFLDLIGTSFGTSLVVENNVLRLLTALPNLTSLAVDPGLVKDLHVHTWIRGQGSVAIKRLEFLGVMDNNETELRKAKVLASEVAQFGTFEGEMRILEYFSKQLNYGFSYTAKRLFTNLLEVAGTPPWNSVALIGFLLKIFKNDDIQDERQFFRILKKLLTADMVAKLDDVLLYHCMETIFRIISELFWVHEIEIPEFISGTIDIMMDLDGIDGKLYREHYVSLVPMVMNMAERAIMLNSLAMLSDPDIGMEGFKGFLKKITQLLEKAVDRIPEDAFFCGVPSFLVVINMLKDLIVFLGHDRADLLEVFSGMIASLRKVCLHSGPRRAAFSSMDEVKIFMELLTDIINGSLVGLAESDSFALLEILKSNLQDTELDLSESEMVASGLETLLLSVHKQWELWKSSDSHNSERETTHYFQLESISGLLNLLESDPRYDYKPSAAVKEIMMKFLK